MSELKSPLISHLIFTFIYRTEQELQVAEKALRKSIQKIESQNDDPAHVREMFNTCKEKYDSSKEIVQLLGRNLDLITKSIEERMVRYPQIVKRVGKTVERMFHNVLKLRQYQVSRRQWTWT